VNIQDAPVQDGLTGSPRSRPSAFIGRGFLFILVGVIVLAASSQTPGFAQEGEPPRVPDISMPQGQEISPPLRGAALIAAAQTSGPMKVIVELNVRFIPEGRLIRPSVETVATSGAVQAQRTAIANTKTALIGQIAAYNVTVTATWQGLPGIAVTADAAGLQALLNSPLVAAIYEDVPEPATMGYNLPYLNVSSTGGAWAQGVDGSGQVVAVLDQGAFSSHQFLSGKVVAEACFSNFGGSGEGSSLCPGGAATATGSGAASPYARCVSLTGDPGMCEHGTHVAGIVAGNWGYYTAPSLIQPINMGGVARGAALIPIQVFTYFSDCGNQPCVGSYQSDQISAINYVYNTLASVGPGAGAYNIAAINMSLGGGHYSGTNCDASDPTRQAALAQLRGVGIAPVIASGNGDESGNGYTDEIAIPGCLSAAVAVGATETNFLSAPITTYISPNWPTNAWCAPYGHTCYGSGTEKIALFSNGSPALELLAPGYFVESSVLGANSGVTNAYDLMPGTSMASPIVAGAWAVLKQQSPVASVDRILGTLQSTGVGIVDSPYTGNSIYWWPSPTTYRVGASGTTYKRIDVGAAVLALGRDFGDAPNSYGTLNASNGARHIRVLEYYLGASADSEADGTPGVDDGDDGVIFPTMNAGTTAYVDVTASVVQTIGYAPNDNYLGRLYAWIDFNHDGDFADAGEQVVNGLVMTGPYPQAVPITIPVGATPGATWARFRYSTQTGLSFNGQAYNGEVEDYSITLVAEPEIEVAGPGPVTIGDGGSYDLGATVVGTPVTRTITVSNVGSLALTLSTNPPTVSGDFSATSFGTTSIAPSGSTTFDLTCDATTAANPATGTVSFNNNDADENPFNFTVTCTVLTPPAAPSGLSATGVSGVGIDLSWTDNSSDETNFHIERSPAGENDWEEIGTVGANVTTYADTDLTCDTSYDYQVRAYRSGVIDLFSDYSNVATGTTTAQCPPTLLSPPDGTLTNNNAPTFTWETLAWASLYRIQIDNDPAFGSSPAVDAVTNDPTYTPLAPLADGVYYWRVSGLDAGSHPGAWSDAWTFTLDPLRLAAPALSSPKDHTYTKDTTPTLSWKSVKGAVLYEVEISDDYTFGVRLAYVQTTSRKYTLPTGSELDYGEVYWRVRAQDGNGNWSDWSYTNTLTITILSSPKNAQHLTDTTPTLRWQSAASGALYEVEVDKVGGNFSDPIFTYHGTARYVTVTPDLSGGDYQWHAQAYTGTGWSEWTPAWTFTITPPTTTRPALVSPANRARLDTTTPAFEWSVVPNGVTYQIQIATNSSFKTPVQDVTRGVGVLTYSADPLPDGGKYYWRVRAINSEGVAGAWSAKWQFTLNQLVKPVLVAPASGTQTTDTAPVLSWDPVTGAVEGYEIQIDTDRKFGTPDQNLTTAGTTITPAALADGKTYWRVRAVSAEGVTGLWSAAWNFTVDTTGPDQPVLRSPADHAGTRDTTPTLSWKSAKTAKQYHVQVAEALDFTVAHTEVDVTVTGRSYTVQAEDALDYGVHYWRVEAFDALGNEGDWSTPFQFALTNMLSPTDGTTTTSTRPTFKWAAVTGAGLYNFELADNPDFIDPETYSGPNRSYRPPAALDAGMYYWHVNVDGGDWMPTWTLVITPAKPGRPKLSSPANKAILGDNTPTFDWLASTNGSTYQIQIDDNGDFSSPAQDVTVGVELLSYIADELPDARYYWHVRAINTDGAPGAWSARWQVTIDTTPPPVPEPLAPMDGAASTNRMLKLSWTKVDGASAYELQLNPDPDPDFPLPVISTGSKTSYTPPTPLSRGIYWWQVRAIDKAGNASAWSDARAFEIVAGVTAPGVEPPTPLPTEPPAPPVEPTVEPTQPPEPTGEPTQPPEPTVEPTQPPEPTIVPIVIPTVELPTLPDNP
jgi:hypothetical protein